MAASTAHIHATFFSPTSKQSTTKPPRTVFFGRRATATKLKKSRAGGPVQAVAERVVGIDMGTTNSAAAAIEDGRPVIVPNSEGHRTTPSAVAFSKTKDLFVGQIAKRQAVVNPENTFFSVKRFIGRKMSEVDEEAKQVSYTVVRDENGNAKLECPAMGRQFAPEELSSMVREWRK